VKRRILTLISLIFAIFLVAGCAYTPGARDQNSINLPYWHGRLSMQVDANPDQPQSQRQSFSASFELTGTPNAGDLVFFTPIGSTAAAIHWTPDVAMLTSQGETRSFSGLGTLIENLLGTPVPVLALFDWLDGRNMQTEGWEVDLTQFTQGKIAAQRLTPLPQAQLRLILEP
jgi:outer membrane lipoprotein LolB